MLDALQMWLPDPSDPLSPLIGGLATAFAIMVVGGALSCLGRDTADLVTQGSIPLRPLVGGERRPFPERRPSLRSDIVDPQYPTALALALSVTGGRVLGGKVESPPGCVRTEVRVRMPYGRDFTRTMAVILEGCRACEGVLEEPAPGVSVAGLADSAIELVARVWSPAGGSAAVAESLRGAIEARLSQAGLDIAVEDVAEERLIARHQRS